MYNDEEKDYCLISKEILFLLEWLLMQDMNNIEKVLKKSWKNGLDKFIKEKSKEELIIDQVASQKIIFYFFSFLENTLKKLENKKSKKGKKIENQKENNLLKHEDDLKLLSFLDNPNTIQDLYLTKKKQKNNNTEKDKKKNLYKDFLENWHPKKSLAE